MSALEIAILNEVFYNWVFAQVQAGLTQKESIYNFLKYKNINLDKFDTYKQKYARHLKNKLK